MNNRKRVQKEHSYNRCNIISALHFVLPIHLIRAVKYDFMLMVYIFLGSSNWYWPGHMFRKTSYIVMQGIIPLWVGIPAAFYSSVSYQFRLRLVPQHTFIYSRFDIGEAGVRWLIYHVSFTNNFVWLSTELNGGQW